MSIPFYPDRETSAPLRRIIATVADRAGVTPQLVSIVASHFFEGVTDEVCHGRVVRFPGFGIWGPYTRRVRGPKGEDSSLAVTPRFSASKGFRLQVRATCPPNASGAKRMRRHSINSAPSSRSVSCGARVFTAQQAFRDHITRQLLGYVDPD
jgi:nucleoid DNA-binding protein